jgi:hypothetical protein
MGWGSGSDPRHYWRGFPSDRMVKNWVKNPDLLRLLTRAVLKVGQRRPSESAGKVSGARIGGRGH